MRPREKFIRYDLRSFGINVFIMNSKVLVQSADVHERLVGFPAVIGFSESGPSVDCDSFDAVRPLAEMCAPGRS